MSQELQAILEQGLDTSRAQPLADLIPGRFQTVTYAAAMSINFGAGRVCIVNIADAVAFQFTAPVVNIARRLGMVWWLNIRNTSGGAHGAGTFAAPPFLVSGAVPAIANGFNRWFAFWFDGTSHRELFRTAADVPNA
jgi:hypothetical protein